MTSFSKEKEGLEAKFFAKVDEELLKKIAREEKELLDIQALKKLTGIRDEEVLKKAVKAKIGPETLLAFSLLPILRIAWADGKMDSKERSAILEGAHHFHIEENSAGFELLKHWLDDSPSEDLWNLWKVFFNEFKSHLSHDEIQNLEKEILSRALVVAKSSGTLFGISVISKAEEKIISELKEVLNSRI